MNSILQETSQRWEEFSPQQRAAYCAVNLLTLMRPMLAGIVAYRGRKPGHDWTYGDAALLAACYATDAEGSIARHYDVVSEGGGYADQAVDKIANSLVEGTLVDRGEEDPARFRVREQRDRIVTQMRNEIMEETGGEVSVKAQLPGKIAMVARCVANIASITPLASRYPRTRNALQGIATASTVVSGITNLYSFNKARSDWRRKNRRLA